MHIRNVARDHATAEMARTRVESWTTPSVESRTIGASYGSYPISARLRYALRVQLTSECAAASARLLRQEGAVLTFHGRPYMTGSPPSPSSPRVCPTSPSGSPANGNPAATTGASGTAAALASPTVARGDAPASADWACASGARHERLSALLYALEDRRLAEVAAAMSLSPSLSQRVMQSQQPSSPLGGGDGAEGKSTPQSPRRRRGRLRRRIANDGDDGGSYVKGSGLVMHSSPTDVHRSLAITPLRSTSSGSPPRGASAAPWPPSAPLTLPPAPPPLVRSESCSAASEGDAWRIDPSQPAAATSPPLLAVHQVIPMAKSPLGAHTMPSTSTLPGPATASTVAATIAQPPLGVPPSRPRPRSLNSAGTATSALVRPTTRASSSPQLAPQAALTTPGRPRHPPMTLRQLEDSVVTRAAARLHALASTERLFALSPPLQRAAARHSSEHARPWQLGTPGSCASAPRLWAPHEVASLVARATETTGTPAESGASTPIKITDSITTPQEPHRVPQSCGALGSADNDSSFGSSGGGAGDDGIRTPRSSPPTPLATPTSSPRGPAPWAYAPPSPSSVSTRSPPSGGGGIGDCGDGGVGNDGNGGPMAGCEGNSFSKATAFRRRRRRSNRLPSVATRHSPLRLPPLLSNAARSPVPPPSPPHFLPPQPPPPPSTSSTPRGSATPTTSPSRSARLSVGRCALCSSRRSGSAAERTEPEKTRPGDLAITPRTACSTLRSRGERLSPPAHVAGLDGALFSVRRSSRAAKVGPSWSASYLRLTPSGRVLM